MVYVGCNALPHIFQETKPIWHIVTLNAAVLQQINTSTKMAHAYQPAIFH